MSATPTPCNPKQRAYVAFDIESAGSDLDRPVLAVGVCHGTNLIDYGKRRWCIEFQRAQIEKRCMDEFWSKHEDILQTIEKEARNPYIVWKQIARFIDDLETLYPRETHDIIFVSDNPAFDIALIDRNLKSMVDRLPLRYTKDGMYRTISDPSEQRRWFPKRKELDEFVKENSIHDHLPDNDAEQIYLMQVFMEGYHESLRK
jgi:hypothetical protein